MRGARQSIHGGWGSRWTFVAAAACFAVGLGNLWRFAYLAGVHGGGSFVLVYVLCVLLVALPVLIAEVVLGSRGRSDPIHSMQNLTAEATTGRGWQVIGWLGVLAGLLVLSYYSVVGGWVLAYVEQVGRGTFEAASARQSGEQFGALLASPGRQLFWHSLFMALTALVVALGVRRGVGLVMRLSVPLLFLVLIGMVLYSAQRGDWASAWSFLFRFRAADFNAEMVLVALGQAFFSLGIGMGAMMAYGAYAPDRRSIAGMLGMVAIFDTTVALLAGLAIFPLVFALHIQPGYGPGLMFVSLPYIFGNMPYGGLVGAAFFALVGLVALSSAVALLEPAVAWLVQRLRWWRPAAAALLASVVWALGVMTILSFNVWAGVRWQGRGLFAWLDLLTANLLLPLVGLLIALFVGWRMRAESARDELYVESRGFFWLWRWLLRYIAPPAVLAILATGLYRSWVG